MTFGMDQLTGYAHDLETTIEPEFAYQREARILIPVKACIEEMIREIGGYLAVTVKGHFNEHEGGVGDNLNIQISSILPPPAPVRDAGLDAAGGSARNYPPEASTAAPATEDLSPPATQEPIPQPADAVPPTVVAPAVITDTPESTESDTSTGATEPQPAGSQTSEAEGSSDSEEQAS